MTVTLHRERRHARDGRLVREDDVERVRGDVRAVPVAGGHVPQHHALREAPELVARRGRAAGGRDAATPSSLMHGPPRARPRRGGSESRRGRGATRHHVVSADGAVAAWGENFR